MEKQEVSKRVQVYLPEELASRVEQLAKAEHMTISSCCSVMIADAMQEMLENNPSVAEVTDGDSDESVHIRLYGKDASLLKKKAAELHLNPTAWVRNAVLRKDLTIHRIEFGDLHEMSAIYGRLVSSIEGIVSVCRDTYNVFPQDVERIIDLMETIRDQHIIVMTSVLGKRKAEKKKRVKRGLW